MVDSFFSKFPLVLYNNQAVVDITKRAVLSNTNLLNPYLFYPKKLMAGRRSDQNSRDYFSDPYREWMIWITNNQIDPYNSAYMDGNQFTDYIITKYGTIANAQTKIMYYTNNWYNGGNIDIGTYNSLSADLQKYYQPIFDGNGFEVGYSRTPIDWPRSTNHLVNYTFTISIPTFINDEKVNVNFTSNTSGTGQVAVSSNNVLAIQHVTGTYQPNGSINTGSFSIRGVQSNSLITIANNNQVIVNAYDTFFPDEAPYYDPVYAYDYETNLNEANKTVKILQTGYIRTFSDGFKKAINS